MSEKRLCVCIILEGSYPYITGGVSAWVHDLIKNLPEIDFKLFTISPLPNQPLRYELPPNVVESRDILVGVPYEQAKVKTPLRGLKLMREIFRFHMDMKKGKDPDIGGLFRMIPEGTYLNLLAEKSRIGWNMIVDGNRENNPLYPFSDYYWAWKSSHDMVFFRPGSTGSRSGYLSCRINRICGRRRSGRSFPP